MTNQPHREWIYRMAFEAGRTLSGTKCRRYWQRSIGSLSKAVRPLQWPVTAKAPACTLCGGARYAHRHGARQRISSAARSRVDRADLSRRVGTASRVRRRGTRAPGRAAPPDRRGEPAIPRSRDRRRDPQRATAQLPMVRSPRRRSRLSRLEVARAGTNIELVERDGTAALLRRLGGTPAAEVQLPLAPETRMHRQFDQIVAHTQAVIRASDTKRAAFWSQGSPASKREYVWNEVIGRLPAPSVPANPRSRLIYDEPKFRGYEVMLDVWPGVFAYGILLVPKDIKDGERRPVVVCQHGLEGRPATSPIPSSTYPHYHRFAARLAEEGFITFAPQNPYIGEDRFRADPAQGTSAQALALLLHPRAASAHSGVARCGCRSST